MTMFLSPTDMQAIEARVSALEKSHGVEVVTIVVGRSDVYPETVWKAFALGASLTALAVTIAEVVHPDWQSAWVVLSAVLAILGVGALCALASAYVPAFARLFLRDARAALEVHQFAKMQFLERELFATATRTAILVVVSLLERRVVILADTGLRAHVGVAEWDAVIARMTPPLGQGRVGEALQTGLAAIGELLAGKGVARGPGNAFADKPVEEAGP